MSLLRKQVGFLVTRPLPDTSQSRWSPGLSELEWVMGVIGKPLYESLTRTNPGTRNSPPITVTLNTFCRAGNDTQANTVKSLTYSGPSAAGFINLFISFHCLSIKYY